MKARSLKCICFGARVQILTDGHGSYLENKQEGDVRLTNLSLCVGHVHRIHTYIPVVRMYVCMSSSIHMHTCAGCLGTTKRTQAIHPLFLT